MPERDDQKLFELLNLEGAQAGLSWITVLRKRERYREVFDGFDPLKIAGYDDKKRMELLADPGIIRNRLKVNAFIENAKAFLQMQDQGESFSEFIWDFVDGEPQINQFKKLSEIPAETEASGAMSKALKKRGFRFVGPTICYAFMQAAGLVDDHITSCFRRTG